MPYRVTVADGLAPRSGRAAARPASSRAWTGSCCAPASPAGCSTAAGADARRVVTDAGTDDDAAQFDLFDWDLGVLTLRNAAHRPLRRPRRRGRIARRRPRTARRLGRARDLPPRTARRRHRGAAAVLTGRYAVVDPADGRGHRHAPDAAGRRALHRAPSCATASPQAVAAAAAADAVVLVARQRPAHQRPRDPGPGRHRPAARAGAAAARGRRRAARDRARRHEQLPVRGGLGRRAPARRAVDLARRPGDRPRARRRAARRRRPARPAPADLVPRRRRSCPHRSTTTSSRPAGPTSTTGPHPLYPFGHGLSYTAFALTATSRSSAPSSPRTARSPRPSPSPTPVRGRHRDGPAVRAGGRCGAVTRRPG